MRIYRTPEQIEECRGYGGVYEIELTPEEIAAAYDAHKNLVFALDIAQQIDDFIEDADASDRFAEDWSTRCGEAWCYAFRKTLEANDHIMGEYTESVRDYTDKKLRELGFDPETMERIEYAFD